MIPWDELGRSWERKGKGKGKLATSGPDAKPRPEEQGQGMIRALQPLMGLPQINLDVCFVHLQVYFLCRLVQRGGDISDRHTQWAPPRTIRTYLFPNSSKSIPTARLLAFSGPSIPTFPHASRAPPGSRRSLCAGTDKPHWLCFLWLPLSRRGQSSLHELGSRAQHLGRRRRDGSFEMATAHSSNPQPVIPGPFPWAQIKMAVSPAVGEPCRRGYLISTQPCGEP